MNEVDDMNSLDSVALNSMQLALIGDALKSYDAPEMYWGDNERSSDFRRECADDMRSRIDRALQNNGLRGAAVAFSEEEYRVTIEALIQYGRAEDTKDTGELIKHLQWFKREA